MYDRVRCRLFEEIPHPLWLESVRKSGIVNALRIWLEGLLMVIVSESKIELTHRLQAEGRWSAGCRYRDAARQRLRAAGLRRADAREGAWREMAEAFPPDD